MIYALSLGGKVGTKRDKKKNPTHQSTFSVFSIEKNNFWISLFSHHFQSAELTKKKKKNIKRRIPPFRYLPLPPPLEKKRKHYALQAVFSSLQMPTRPQCKRAEPNGSHRSFSSISSESQRHRLRRPGWMVEKRPNAKS